MNTENINIEDIKVGETYNVRMFVSHYSKGIISCCTVIGYDEVDGIQCGEEYDICHDEIAAFSPVTSAPKYSEPAPKYDPNRLFKKGDKVRVVERDGRDYIDYDPYTNIQKSEIYTVLENENEVIDGGCVDIIIGKGNIEQEIPFYFLELVTPVEELEPYYVRIGGFNDEWHLWRIDNPNERTLIASFNKSHPHAKAAAEAECKRLNDEYRKE